MAQAGYQPTEAVTFWRRMQALTGNGGPPHFLATHPSKFQALTPAPCHRTPGTGQERAHGW